jgi:uncharacterized membrane protein
MVMSSRNSVLTAGSKPSGRRASACRRLVLGVLGLGLLVHGPRLTASAIEPQPDVTVREAKGVYSVSARFVVPEPEAVARAVLTDYEQIPRFMPDVRSSKVLERAGGVTVVEQQAVARFLMFSRRIHLVLEVREESRTIRFLDRCGASFVQYEGMWQTADREGTTVITYNLTARPSFDVPEFLLTRLLKRDATRMIDRLRIEIASRSAR